MQLQYKVHTCIKQSNSSVKSAFPGNGFCNKICQWSSVDVDGIWTRFSTSTVWNIHGLIIISFNQVNNTLPSRLFWAPRPVTETKNDNVQLTYKLHQQLFYIENLVTSSHVLLGLLRLRQYPERSLLNPLLHYIGVFIIT